MVNSTPRTDSPNLTAPWSLILALAAFAVVLSMVARGDGTLWIDARATELIQRGDGSLFSALANVGNALGEGRYAGIVVAIPTVLTIIARRWRDLAFLLVLVLFRGLGTLLKEMLDSPRPTADIAEVTERFDGLGFPSGHSMTSAVAVGGIAFLILRRNDSPTVRQVLALASLVWVALTAFARIWVGAHWLTDTIGGTVFGVVIVLVSANLSALVVSHSGASSIQRKKSAVLHP